MAEVRNYTIGKNRIEKANMKGFSYENEKIRLLEGQNHALFLPPINSYEEGSVWGILRLQMQLPENCIYIIRAFAMDITETQQGELEKINDFLLGEEPSLEEKIAFFENAECEKIVNSKHLLLYNLKGQYLWICLEVRGVGTGEISHIYLQNSGDNFMQTFPEIYQERGGFFHRYMSIFSSLYGEMQEKIENVEKILDFDTAPEQFLQMYAKWLGLELEGNFLEEQILRKLLKEIYQLNRMKGTKTAVKRLIELVLDEDAIIVERNLIDSGIVKEENALYNQLYGTGKYDITVLINRKSDEKMQAQLLYLLKQFKPIRSKVKLVFYQKCNQLDSYCYLNRNAVLGQTINGTMDENYILDGSVILQ